MLSLGVACRTQRWPSVGRRFGGVAGVANCGVVRVLFVLGCSSAAGAAPELPEMALKVFNLICTNEHPFEGWFSSENDYETQIEKGLLVCPMCGSGDVRKTPTAARLNFGAQPVRQQALMPTPQQMQTAFLRMAREIAANTEDVGDRFAEEARRIHYEEAPTRGIRGTTTREEAAALEDEGINVMPFPFADLLKEPLQ
jgi:hypothetical protein